MSNKFFLLQLVTYKRIHKNMFFLRRNEVNHKICDDLSLHFAWKNVRRILLSVRINWTND